MKYIRTKDGKIFEIEKDLGKYGKSKVVIICDFNGNFIDVEKQNMIQSQADTIEELCDEFVMLDTNFGNIVVPDMEAIRFNLSKSGYVHRCSEIYGAIWTSKGLTYVAKMKENGELELL